MACWIGLASPLVDAKSAAAKTAAATDWASLYVDGLRQRGWHDVVLEYLDRANQDPLTSDGFLVRIGYERAISQAAVANQTPGARQRQKLLATAAAGFLKYARENPNSRLEVDALGRAGNLFVQQCLSELARADRLPKTAAEERRTHHQSARTILDQAVQSLEKLCVSSTTQLESVPKGAALQNAPDARALRDFLENRKAEAQFQLAKLLIEKSRTYDEDSPPHKKTLQEAATSFAQLHNDYRQKLIGFYGRLYEGRCYQLLGKAKDALECFDDLVDQPIANPDFRRLVSRAYRRRAELHLAADRSEEAIQECRAWLDEAHKAELGQKEWLAVSYRLANAYEAQARTPAGSKDAKRLRSEARKLLREVARGPGEFQREARVALTSSGGSNEPPVVKTVADGMAAGKEALEEMNSSQLAARLAAKNNPGAVGDLQQQVKLHQSQAKHYFRLCQDLADDDTPPEKLVSARYYLCWLYWEEGRLPEAALIGNFLARRYSEHHFAPVAAKLALAAYERMYNEARRTDAAEASYQAQQLTQMADLLISRWPESAEAPVATNILLNIALQDNRIADAEAILNQLPAASRGQAELSLGGSLWLQATTDNPDASAEEQAKQKKRALDMLSMGFESVRTREDPSEPVAAGALFLTQALLAEGEYLRAIEVLVDPKVGPLTLVHKKATVARRPKFIRDVYKAALRAFLSVTPPRREEAHKIMGALEASYGSDEDASEQLTRTYLSLGLQLQRQLTSLAATGQKAKARAVAGAFEDLVQRVSDRASGSESWKIQNWIALTNLQLGQGLHGETAARYFTHAEDTYRALLAKAAEDPKFAPSENAVLGARKRLGDCLLSQRKFAESYDEYITILQAKPNLLELQQATAAALQTWGTADKNPAKLELAIRGTQPQTDKKNLVWGWLRLSTIADHQRRKALQTAGENSAETKKFHDLFFASRLQVSRARFTAATLAGGDSYKQQLRKAKQSLTSMQRLYPKLGGPQWKTAYLKLLKEIEDASP
ncbi:MAG: hypothetical protein MK171_09605 [Pirellulales bacterium]|nr:hypothetical protein [Pirellulales bacterium]